MTRSAVVVLCALIAGLLSSSPARAEFPKSEPYLGLAGGYNWRLTDWDLGFNPPAQPESSGLGVLRLGYQLQPRFALEAGIGLLPLKSTTGGSNTVLAYDASALYHLTDGEWAPFAIGGLGGYNAVSGDLDTDIDPTLHLGIGLRGLLLPWLALRVQVRDVLTDGFEEITSNLELTAGLDIFVARPSDRDEDGIEDDRDRCPDVKGVAETDGCPDSDRDGIADDDDACPQEPGPKATRGCPDRDGDGIADREDKCPDVAGLAELQGCPDADGDGITDAEDKCPNEKGLKELNGCPDRDGDGIADGEDKCPDVKGVPALAGCPDRDGDGITDADDKCPDVAGTKLTGGCPDRDGDSVVDDQDECPDQPGLPSFKGCIPKEVKKFTGAIKGINFELNKDTILPSSFPVLDAAVDVMQKFPELRLRIEGHTDNAGAPEYNLDLSKRRAASVRTYLVGKGIAENRLESEGYGDTKPVADNKTKAGRAQNRRVEFTVLGQE